MLFPRDKGNRDGTKPILGSIYSHAHRIFADAIAHLLTDADGQQVNPALVVPYAYRHSYAQRHADAVHTTLEAGDAYTSIDITVQYLRPVTSDSGVLRATGRVTKRGRRVAFATAEVVDGGRAGGRRHQ